MDLKIKFTRKYRSQPEKLCWLIVMLPFLFAGLIELLGLPGLLKYVLDVAWVVLLLFMLRFQKRIAAGQAKRLLVWTAVFLVYTFCGYLLQFQSPLYYLWGVRNNFRFYVAFAAFAVFLSPRDAKGYLTLFDKLFWVNVAVSMVQFFFLGKYGDYLGGLFGTAHGCNGYSFLFFSIVLIKSVIFYLEKKEKLWSCAAKFVATMAIAAMAEMKFFFAVAVAIVVLAVLFTDFSWRKLSILAMGMCAIGVGMVVLSELFPGFGSVLDLQRLWDIATSNKGYTASGDMNRLTAIPVINERFFDRWELKLVGFGLGNCDTSSFAFLNTPFFTQYEWLHYTWLSTAFMYLETGWIGMIFFFGFFVLAFFVIRKLEKSCDGEVKPYCRIARIMAVVCIINAIYNSALRTEAGYMAYFVLAIPFALTRQSAVQKAPKLMGEAA